jgi:hypothetical protein
LLSKSNLEATLDKVALLTKFDLKIDKEPSSRSAKFFIKYSETARFITASPRYSNLSLLSLDLLL